MPIIRSGRRVLDNSSWLIASSIFTMAIGVVVTGVAARHFGPSTFGALNYAIALVSLLAAIATLGMESLTVKDLVQDHREEGTVLCTSFVLRVMSGLLVMACSYIAISVIDPGNRDVKFLVLIMSSAMSLKAFDVVDYWMQAHLKAKVASSIRMSVYVLTAGLRITVVLFDGGLLAYAGVYVLDAILFGLAVLLAYLRMREEPSAWRIDWSYARYILSRSGPLIMSGLMVSLYNRIDQVMLGAMLPDKAEVGIYSASVTIAEMWYFIPNALIVSVAPVIFDLKKRDLVGYERAMQMLYSVVVSLGLAAGVGITIFSHLIIRLIYGAQYADAAGPLVVLVWAGTFAMLGVSRSVWLLSEGLQKYAVAYTLAALVVNLVFNLVLIPRYGASGAAWATLAAQFVNIVILSLFRDTSVSTLMIIRSFSPVGMIQSIKEIARMR